MHKDAFSLYGASTFRDSPSRVTQHFEFIVQNWQFRPERLAALHAATPHDGVVTGLFTLLSTPLPRKEKCLFAARVTEAIAMHRINWKK